MTEKLVETEPEVSRASRLSALEAQVQRLERQLQELYGHYHPVRSHMLNYVDKPVLIKAGSFVPLQEKANGGAEPASR